MLGDNTPPVFLPSAEFSACRPSARSSNAPRSCFTARSVCPRPLGRHGRGFLWILGR
jgi:hypothetical protein